MTTISANAWVTEYDPVVPARRQDLAEYVLDEQVVLYDPADGATYRMNETALAVWRKCDGHRTIRELAEDMTREFDVELDAALDDVEQLAALFAESDLIARQSEID
jgi:hypothetical protein